MLVVVACGALVVDVSGAVVVGAEVVVEVLVVEVLVVELVEVLVAELDVDPGAVASSPSPPHAAARTMTPSRTCLTFRTSTT